MGWSSLAVLGIVGTCIALFFQAIGFAIPFWVSRTESVTVSSEAKDVGIYVNVWYVMACYKGEADSCTSDAIKPSFDRDSAFDNENFTGTVPSSWVDNATQVLGKF